MFRSIWFDIDDTLYQRNQPFIAACEHLLAGRMALDWAELFRVRNRYSDRLSWERKKTGISEEELYILRMRYALEEYGQKISDDQALEFEAFYEKQQGNIRLYDGYRELLDELVQRGVRLGVITNGNALRQKQKFDLLGMSAWVPEERCLVSGAVGCQKPEKAIFDLALQRAGLEDSEQVWYIGDNYPMDAEGAAAAGWHTVWFNANGDPLPEKRMFEADARVKSVKELSDFLLFSE